MVGNAAQWSHFGYVAQDYLGDQEREPGNHLTVPANCDPASREKRRAQESRRGATQLET
jgi:hypothetical protein